MIRQAVLASTETIYAGWTALPHGHRRGGTCLLCGQVADRVGDRKVAKRQQSISPPLLQHLPGSQSTFSA